jgi:prepilin-type N-terminal cleavage/methylation domain-containing protein/prepilin-type processing-associated H-X9-DG protein
MDIDGGITMRFRNGQRGFTLIELLVVIAIIAILAAILFPVFAQARESARKTQCLSNTRQIGTAVMMYVQDYDETFFPQPWPGGCAETGYFTNNPNQPRQHWATMVYPYIKNGGIFDCPSYSGVTYIAAYALWECGRGANSPRIVPFVEYGLNEMIFGNAGANGVPIPTPLAKLQEAASIGIIADNNYIYSWRVCMIGPADSQNFRKYWPEGRNGWEFYQGRPRHQGGMNFTYADGHSKWARAADTPGNRPDYEKGYYPVLMTDGRFPTQAACESSPD